MKVIETKVFTFDELNPKAKEKARDWWRSCDRCDTSWSDFVIEDAESMANDMGIELDQRLVPLMNGKQISEPAIYWRGFWSQGDGACFNGNWRARDVKPGKVKANATQDVELHRISAEFERIAALFPYSRFSVKHQGHYYHEYCTDFEVHIYDNEDNELDTLESAQAEKDLIETAREFMVWIYNQLEKEYNWQNADEQVDETLVSNEYTFTETGKRFG